MKKYTFELVVHEGSDEFWEDILASGKSGCDEVREAIKDALDSNGWYDMSLILTRFESVA